MNLRANGLLDLSLNDPMKVPIMELPGFRGSPAGGHTIQEWGASEQLIEVEKRIGPKIGWWLNLRGEFDRHTTERRIRERKDRLSIDALRLLLFAVSTPLI